MFIGITKSELRLSLLAALVFTLGSTAFAATEPAKPPPHVIYVGSCQAGSSATIQAAVNGVAINGIVNVCPGTYPEQVTISRGPLTLQGAPSGAGDAAVVVPPDGGLQGTALPVRWPFE